MDRQLSEEAALIAGMLDAASTMAAAREGEAQETFNALTAVAALGLGIPALVLAYYGADRLLPLNDWRRAGAMLPIALAAVAAGLLAQRRLPARHVNRRQKLQVVLSVASLIVLLALAGLLAPDVGR
jgi:peptidoglycan/LPS O-acetylase OafA/YrhL